MLLLDRDVGEEVVVGNGALVLRVIAICKRRVLVAFTCANPDMQEDQGITIFRELEVER